MVKMINFTDTRISEMGPFPKLEKQGFVADNGGESTPFVWKSRLVRSEMIWGVPEQNGDPFSSRENYGRIVDHETGEVISEPFLIGKNFVTVYCEGNTVYAFATLHNKIFCESSQDLIHWESFTEVSFPGMFTLFNTGICFGEGKYHMAIEFSNADGQENPYVGVPFTITFAESEDLHTWTLLPFENAFGQDRYAACPTLHYSNGWFYMISLEALPHYRFAPYIYRTKNFQTWEIGYHNPVLLVSEEDRHAKKGLQFTSEYIQKTEKGFCSNESDVEVCEFEGKTHIIYSTGNQWTWGGVVCEAIYDGSMQNFFESFFS